MATISLEAAVAFALEIGSSAPEPTVTRNKAGALLVGGFRRAPPMELSKKKTKEGPKCWGSK